MTISIWRFSHLALAISSFLFIALASVTGIILAFEPVAKKVQPYRSSDFDRLTVADLIPVVQKNYTDITEVTVDDNDFILVKASNADLEEVKVYFDPATGRELGQQPKKNEFFQWVTDLHRSLFIHQTGRFLIGLASFLLLLITISGTVLIIQRQRGVKRFFSKIIKDGFAQYYHVVLGRLSLLVIIIIALSGTILSLDTFDLLPGRQEAATVDLDKLRSAPKKAPASFEAFRSIRLSDVKSIEFPFSEDVEDYFTLRLKDKEITVNQVTGDIITEQLYPAAAVLSRWSMNLHTGRTNAVWAIILGIACLNILFFIWSGFVITLKRIKGRSKNKYKAAESNIIILVGSENGHTFQYAKSLQQQLLKLNQRPFIAQLNDYQVYPKASYIIIMTATYGLGDAPTNASKFFTQLIKFPQIQPVHFSVLGFGSHAYPDFCKYAFEVSNQLSLQSWATPLMEIHTVNDRSPVEFLAWADLWSQKAGLPLEFSLADFKSRLHQLDTFLLERKQLAVDSDNENSFLMQLKPLKRRGFRSGDLLNIYPANDHRERQYSIGKVNGQVQLSVKLHSNGLGSGFLNNLEVGQELKARIVPNPTFHFPVKARLVIMIANGTGIAPFLGMIEENNGRTNVELYAGFKNNLNFDLYKSALEKATQDKKLQRLNIALSREGNKEYVSHLIQRDAAVIAAALAGKSVLMICGSLSMQTDITALLDNICMEINKQPLSYYQSHGQVLMDCY